jgi:hypothetical protein
VVPEGTSIFRTYFAPADFMEAVNTIGLPLYAKMVSTTSCSAGSRFTRRATRWRCACARDAVIKVTKS